MNTAAPDESPATSEVLQLDRWHGFANAAAVALFGVPLINTAVAARAAWVEVTTDGRTGDERPQNQPQILIRHFGHVQIKPGFGKQRSQRKELEIIAGSLGMAKESGLAFYGLMTSFHILQELLG